MRFITLKNNEVTGIRYGKAIANGEIESEIGNLRQIRQLDGSFIDNPLVIEEQNRNIRLSEINQRLTEIRLKKELFEFGGLTQTQYEPYRLEAISLLSELENL